MRSTSALALDSTGVDFGTPDDADERQEGTLSLVTEEPSNDRFARRLPALYFGRTLVFSSRDVDEVAKKVRETVDTLRVSQSSPTYLVQGCRSDGIIGLYAHEFNVRAANRKRLERAGLAFAEDPFCRLGADGRFSCDDFGIFVPRFIFLEGPHGEEMPPGTVVFGLAARRLWIISPSELEELATIAITTPAFGGSTRNLTEARHMAEILSQRI